MKKHCWKNKVTYERSQNQAVEITSQLEKENIRIASEKKAMSDKLIFLEEENKKLTDKANLKKLIC